MVKKFSKNALENRGAKTIKTCGVCDDTQKTFKLIINGKSKMIYECKCGFRNKQGIIIDI